MFSELFNATKCLVRFDPVVYYKERPMFLLIRKNVIMVNKGSVKL